MEDFNNHQSVEYLRKARLEKLRSVALLKKQLNVRKNAQEATKKAAKKTITALIKPLLPYILIGLFFFMIIMVSIPILVYYICEGGGLLPWILRQTSLGGLCQ